MLSRDRRLPDWLRFRLWADAGSKDAALKRAKPGRWRRWRIPSIAALSLAAVLLAAFAALLALPLQAQTTTPVTLVSNTDRTSSGSTNAFGAQSFETGASAGGYTISEVEVRLSSTNNKSTSVRIREDNSGEPATGDPVATLTNPGTLTSGSLNTFTAPAGTTLAPSTIYWITFNEEVTGARANVSLTASDDETGETGWSIGDGRLSRTSETANWSTGTTSYLIEIKRTASTNATLKKLALEGATGGETITLSPGFDAGTGTYTASVVNRIDSVKLTATKKDSNATVAITSDDTGTPEEAELDLIVGSNTLTVTVTAENGTPKTYTITVTRGAAPPAPTDCPADTTWCTTMTVGSSSGTSDQSLFEDFGYLATSNLGDLGSTTFSHGGISYSVSEVYRPKISSLDGNTVVTDNLYLTVIPALPDGAVLQMGSRTFTVNADTATSTPGQEEWDLRANPLIWTAGQYVTVNLKLLDPGVSVSKTALPVVEGNTAGESYTVVLDSPPTAEVVVTVAGHANKDVTPTPTSLTFTTSDWDTAQTVTVTAGDDADRENDTVTLTHVAASADSNYQGIMIDDVTVTVNDDDNSITLVTNTENQASTAESPQFGALSFVTGPNAVEFTIFQVEIQLGAVSGANISVRIREDDGGEPATGEPLATLANPGRLRSNGLNTFTAPAGTTLAPEKTYWLSVHEGITGNRAELKQTSKVGETGETGWSIGDGRLWRI